MGVRARARRGACCRVSATRTRSACIAGLRARVVPPEQIAAAIAELRERAARAVAARRAGRRARHVLARRRGPRADRSARTWGASRSSARSRALGYRRRGRRRVLAVRDVRDRARDARRRHDPAQRRRRARGGERGAARAARSRSEAARLRSRGSASRKLGEMVRLPGGGILERFGSEAHRLYQLAAGERWDPLVPLAPPEAPDERVVLDDDDRRRRAARVRAARPRSIACSSGSPRRAAR